MSIDLGSNPLSFHEAWSGLCKKSLKERQAQLTSLLESLLGPNHKNKTPQKPDVASSQKESLGSHNDAPNKSAACRHHSDSKNGTKIEKRKSSRGKSTRSKIHSTLPVLDDQFANMMIENCIGTMSLPVGLGLNITINGHPLIVPMCVEESSVIAAASSAAKTVTLNGGFKCSSSEKNIIVSQVQLCFSDKNKALASINLLNEKKSTIIDKANEFCPNMCKRGGGVVDVNFYDVIASDDYVKQFYSPFDPSTFPIWVIANLKIDVCESMGANCANSVAEGVSHFLTGLTGATCGVRIVSNFSTDKYSTASFCIDVDSLAYKNYSGLGLAKRIVESNIWASCDINRATTHNKGIMNGVDAVALATGQDWRAIEASAHSYATIRNSNNKYTPLTDYWIDHISDNYPYSEKNKYPNFAPITDGSATPKLYLHGSLTLPIPTGVKGGAISMNSAYTSCLKIIGPDVTSQKLSEIMVATGLAQNFAALRALCTVGIQSGHMSLHSQNIAVQAGVAPELVGPCTEYMSKVGKINSEGVNEFLKLQKDASQVLICTKK